MTYNASVDAARTVLGHLAREWGEYGYGVRVEGDGMLGAIAHVRHNDGSEFTIHADRWGNLLEDT